jgi:site-specific recombinase XerD
MGELVVIGPSAGEAVGQVWQPPPSQADNDDHLVALWLHGRSPRTLASYATEARAFRAFLEGRPLRAVRLGDLHAYIDRMAHLAASSRCTHMGAVKSLLSFGFRIGYLPVNVSAAVRLPAPRRALAERIMTEADTHRLLATPNSPRNRAMLHLLYAAGLRISEVVGLRWRDLTVRDGAGQAAVLGRARRSA